MLINGKEVVLDLKKSQNIQSEINDNKNLPDFIEANISGLEMGNKLYVTKLVADDFKLLHPDNTVVAQVRISRAAMKAAQEAAKAAKGAPAKGKKK